MVQGKGLFIGEPVMLSPRALILTVTEKHRANETTQRQHGPQDWFRRNHLSIKLIAKIKLFFRFKKSQLKTKPLNLKAVNNILISPSRPIPSVKLFHSHAPILLNYFQYLISIHGLEIRLCEVMAFALSRDIEIIAEKLAKSDLDKNCGLYAPKLRALFKLSRNVAWI